MTRPARDERDPAPAQEHTPVSSAWARRQALEACEAAVRAAREQRKKPVGEVAE